MRFAGITALKDLRRRLADPLALLIWMGMPVVIGLILSLIGGGQGAPPKARVLLVDLDQTLVSRLVGMAGSSSQLGEFIHIETVTEEVGRQKINDGEANALLILPKGLQDGFLREQPTTLTLIKNPSQRIMPAIIEEGLKILVEAAFYAQRLLGEPLRQIADGVPAGATTGLSDAAVASISQEINQRLRGLETTLVPPVLSLAAPSQAAEGETLDIGAIFLPSLLFMALMFTAQGVSNDIWIEKTAGTLRRTLCAPQGATAFLAGKVAGGAVIMAGAILLAIGVGMVAFDVALARAPLALAWATFAGAAILCYLVGLQLLASTARGGQLLSMMVVFPLTMIGGAFFPFETMPAWMQSIGRWTPNGLAAIQAKQILFGAIDARAIFIGALGIGLPALAVFFLSVRRLRGAFATS